MRITKFTAAVDTENEYEITALTDFDGLGESGVRHDEDESPRQHGRNYFGSLLDERKISGEWYVGFPTHEEYMEERARAIRAFDYTKGIQTFEVEINDNVTYRFDAYVSLRKMPTRKGFTTAETFRFELTSPKPFIYSATLHETTIPVFTNLGGTPIPNPGGVPLPAAGGVPIGGSAVGATDVPNYGDTAAEPEYYIYGPGTNFTLLNSTTGEEFTITQTLGPTEFMRVSVPNLSSYFGESSPRDEVFTGDYIKLDSGSNIMKLTVGSGADANTKVIAKYRDTYQGI